MLEPSYVLNSYPVAFRRSKIDPLGAAGGMSGAQFWRISGSQGLYVLRRWPGEHPTSEQLRFIHGVLGHAAHKGVSFLPLPIATTDGRTFVTYDGHLWELAPWLPGAADYGQAPSPEKLQNALAALAKFHAATADYNLCVGHQAEYAAVPLAAHTGPCPGIVRRLERLHALHTSGTGELQRAIPAAGDWPELARTAKSFVALLPRAVPLAIGLLAPLCDMSFALQPCLRDVWHDHVLFVGNDVTGLIDFGALAIDAPVVDVSRLLGSLAVDNADDRQRGLAAYAAIRPLTSGELRAVAALDAGSTVLAGCNWIRWIGVENRQFENRLQVEQRMALLLRRLENLVDGHAPLSL